MSDTTLRFAPFSPAPLPSAPVPAVASPPSARPARGLRAALALSPQSALVMASLLIGLVVRGASLLGDPDTQWHIAVGQQIWAAGAVPTTDLYSHTFAGAPWIAKEWLSQLILFGAYVVGAWRGVVLVTALSIGLAFAVLHEWLQRRLHPTLALAMTLAALPLAMPHFLARPHILVLPVIVIWMVGITSAAARDRAPPLAFALVMALWANMHGSFPLGLAMAGLAGLDGMVAAPAGRRLARCRSWALFLAAALACTALSPYGWHAIVVPLRMEGNAATLSYVSEWQPLSFDTEGCLALVALALALAALVRDWRANILRFVAIGLLGAMMVRHSRFISLFAVLAPILVCPALQRFPRFASRPTTEVGVLRGLVGALAAAALAVLLFTAPLPSGDVTPEAAYRAAVAAGAEGPVLNHYDFGGFLIAHGVKTFVDGRTDQLFLGDFLPDYMSALKAKDDAAFSAILQRYRIGWALVRTKTAETRHLAHMPGWTQVYADKVASVFVKH